MTRTPQPTISLKSRHPRWQQCYAQSKWVWKPWHMSLIGHGVDPVEDSPSHMQGLYQTNTQKSQAALDLLSFEGRTRIQQLPPQTGATTGLLVPFSEELERGSDLPFLSQFWSTPHSLAGHFHKHAKPPELPHLQAAAAACMQYLGALTNLPQTALIQYDPGLIATVEGYARLAKLITLLSVAAERPFPFTLYCPRGDYEPHTGLVLNIHVPLSFLQEQNVLATREIVIGLTLARPDVIGQGPTVTYLPVLLPVLCFSTLFAPDARQSTALYGSGRSCSLIL